MGLKELSRPLNIKIMAEKKVTIYSDSETGKGFAPKSADKSKTVTVRINHVFTQIVDDVRKGKNDKARAKVKRLQRSECAKFINLLGEVRLLIESEL